MSDEDTTLWNFVASCLWTEQYVIVDIHLLIELVLVVMRRIHVLRYVFFVVHTSSCCVLGYYAAVLIGDITGLARPSVCLSVRLCVPYGILTRKQKVAGQPKLV